MKVEAGDHLDVQFEDPTQGDTSAGSYSITLPSNAIAGAPITYRFQVGKGTSCTSGTLTNLPANPYSMALRERCLGDQNAVLATAIIGGTTPAAYAFSKDNQRPSVGGSASVALSNWVFPATLLVTAKTPAVEMESHSIALTMFANGAAFSAGPNANANFDQLTSTGIEARMAQDFADALKVSVQMSEVASQPKLVTQGHGGRQTPRASSARGRPDGSLHQEGTARHAGSSPVVTWEVAPANATLDVQLIALGPSTPSFRAGSYCSTQHQPAHDSSAAGRISKAWSPPT